MSVSDGVLTAIPDKSSKLTFVCMHGRRPIIKIISNILFFVTILLLPNLSPSSLAEVVTAFKITSVDISATVKPFNQKLALLRHSF